MFKKHAVLSVIVCMMMSSMALGEEDKKSLEPRAVLESIEMEAKVEAVDYKKREIVLRGSTGDLRTITAGDEAKRFDEIEVGDTVKASFQTYLQAEFREPTADEKATPLVILAEAGKTIDDLPPGAVVGALVKAVVSVEIINRPDMMVTVMGPGGNYVTIPAADVKVIEELHAGDSVILTYAESVTLGLEKM